MTVIPIGAVKLAALFIKIHDSILAILATKLVITRREMGLAEASVTIFA